VASAEGLAVALLAAGRSTRFGSADKLTAALGDRPLIDWAAKAGLSVGAQWQFVVAGPELDADMPGYERLTNSHPEQGLASSLRIAAKRAEALGAGALLILLADVPFVARDHLGRLLAAHGGDGQCCIFSTLAQGVPQPPALFPARYFAALQALEGDKGARGLAQDALFVEAPAGSLLDFDTPADLDLARQHVA